jgi:protein phosphatase
MEDIRPTPPPAIEPSPASAGLDQADSALMLDVAASSHPGKRRLNQDQYLIADLAAARRRESDPVALNAGDANERLLVVADGMGGHPRGEVASLLAVRVLLQELLRGPCEAGEPRRRLECALRASDDALHRTSVRRPDLASMGTTLTAAWWTSPLLHFAHVGDTRLYVLHEHRLERLTRDHTLAAELLARGVAATKAAGFEHVLTQSVGGADHGVEPETGSLRLDADDWLLLCSDGLLRGVTEDEIERALGLADCARTAASALLAGALASDDTDNITALVARVRPAPLPGAPGRANGLESRPGRSQ